MRIRLRSIALISCLFATTQFLEGAPPTKAEWPQLPASELPGTPPFVGPAGNDPYGYPAANPDKAKLLGLLRAKRFDDLERCLTYFQDAFEKDYHKELWPEQAVSAFFADDPALEPILDAWVAASPRSFAAYVARGNYRYKLGWIYRGHEYAQSTNATQFRSMEEMFDEARKDFNKAITLRPGLVAARTRLLLMAGVSGASPQAKRTILQDALAKCPLCFAVRSAAMEQLTPRWGGSYEEMTAFARSVAPLARKNPRLKLLAGFADWDRCDFSLLTAGHPGGAAPCSAAATIGDEPRFLVAKARLLNEDKDYKGALALLDRALQIEPQRRDALLHRYRARVFLGDMNGAVSDLTVAGQLDPADAYLNEQAVWLIRKLASDGGTAAKAGQHQEAEKLFSLALLFAPTNSDLLSWRNASRRATRH